MRALTMAAGDVGGVDASHVSLLGWVGGAITSGLGAFGLWLAQRTMGKAAVQNAINDGFSKLTSDLQEERESLLQECRKLRDEAAARELAWAAERASLKGDIRNLTQVIESLKRELRSHGIPIPGAPITASEPDAGATIIGRDQP